MTTIAHAHNESVYDVCHRASRGETGLAHYFVLALPGKAHKEIEEDHWQGIPVSDVAEKVGDGNIYLASWQNIQQDSDTIIGEVFTWEILHAAAYQHDRALVLSCDKQYAPKLKQVGVASFDEAKDLVDELARQRDLLAVG